MPAAPGRVQRATGAARHLLRARAPSPPTPPPTSEQREQHMRQVARKGLITVAAAGGVLAMSAGAAHADSDATGSGKHSPGVLSGNAVQVPVSVPVNLCGNTINAVGVLNPALGNSCVNGGGHGGDGGAAPHEPGQEHADSGQQQSGHQGGGADADGTAVGSPGVGSGNNVQVPVEVPVNACGNNVSVVGLGNSVTGNTCANDAVPEDHEQPQEPQRPDRPQEPAGPEEPGAEVPAEEDGPDGAPDAGTDRPGEDADPAAEPAAAAAASGGALAETGAGPELISVLPLGAGLLLGGIVLYRRRPVRRG